MKYHVGSHTKASGISEVMLCDTISESSAV